MTATLTSHRISVAEYEAMADAWGLDPESRTELLDGVVFEMPPIGPIHASLVTRLNVKLQRLCGDRAIAWVQNPVLLGEWSRRS